MFSGVVLVAALMIPEADELPCGPRALLEAANIFQISPSPARVLELCGDHPTHSIFELVSAARKLGLSSTVVYLDPWEGPFPADPLIAWLDRQPHGHFVLVRSRADGLWQLWDGDRSPRAVSVAWLARRWTGPSVRIGINPPNQFGLGRAGFVGLVSLLCAVPLIRYRACCRSCKRSA